MRRLALLALLISAPAGAWPSHPWGGGATGPGGTLPEGTVTGRLLGWDDVAAAWEEVSASYSSRTLTVGDTDDITTNLVLTDVIGSVRLSTTGTSLTVDDGAAGPVTYLVVGSVRGSSLWGTESGTAADPALALGGLSGWGLYLDGSDVSVARSGTKIAEFDANGLNVTGDVTLTDDLTVTDEATSVRGTLVGAKPIPLTADFVTSTDTLADITGWTSQTLVAGRWYRVLIQMHTALDAAGGAKWDLDGGTATFTTVMLLDSEVEDATGVSTLDPTRRTAIATDMTSDLVEAPTATIVTISGLVLVNGGGTLKPRFAQETNVAGDSLVLAGSFMQIQDATAP